MEKELVKQVKVLEHKYPENFEEIRRRSEEEENAKEIIHEVLNEIYYSKLGNRDIQRS